MAFLDDEKELENYLNGSNPYCREERQFAAILYQIFLSAKHNRPSTSEGERGLIAQILPISNASVQDLVIRDVFFEAALMRDYHYSNHLKNDGKFNVELLSFCKVLERDTNLGRLKEVNLGTSSAADLFRELGNAKNEMEFNIAKMMMNAKMDILVFYQTGEEHQGKIQVAALECKYKSPEDRYPLTINGVNKGSIPQTLIQDCILAFLFGKYIPYDRKNNLTVPLLKDRLITRKWNDETLSTERAEYFYEILNKSESYRFINRGSHIVLLGDKIQDLIEKYKKGKI